MATEEQTIATAEKPATQVPEWEHEAAPRNGKQTAAGARGLRDKLDRIVPPHKQYLGMRRNVFLWVLLATVLAILALIIGLAAGLSAGHGHSAQDLPLPSNTQTFTGDLTYYEAGLGACGWTDGQSDDTVSISEIVFDAAGSSSADGGNSNDNPLCGKMLRASRFDEQYGQQRSVDLKVVDRCTGCAPDDLDTTIGAFEKLAPVASGRVDVTWAWLEPVATGK